MCLWTNQKVAKTSNRAIVCYKIMLKYGSTVVSPYYASLVPEETLNGGLYIARGPEYIEADGKNYSVGGGFIHAYNNIDTAKNQLLRNFNCYARLYKCVIPAGTRYFESLPGFNEICAKEIRFVEEVK